MTIPQDDIRTGALLLAEFTDLRRAFVTDAALNPGEVQELSEHARALSVLPLEFTARRMLLFFPHAESALKMAHAIQVLASHIRGKDPERHSLSARVVLGYGPMNIVNGRAHSIWTHRLTGNISRAPAHTVVALQAFVDALPAGTLSADAQRLGPDLVMLHQPSVDAVETQMASPLMDPGGVFTAITLRVHGRPQVFRIADCPILLGRDKHCAVQLTSETASRTHGRIEYVHGKFQYVDDSRNGTYVLTSSGEEVRLSRDRVVLTGDGALSPGAPLDQQTGEVVRFSCHSSRLGMADESKHDGDTHRLG
ncbi:FHA domain-containing protein [Sinimarinibacterium sp. CAU 1509]|uniref:FHA domain-containing protein n=1 Tax=Sinimarinibacterium sp. CAU 1509 TaxID=2562283 RepID=UPI0010AC259A|nr:FHA domain-containing protein [Sinimarinibacterium sp. CAU 1509]TJY65044.1 FHA domain-containing protein [Sinimarinibacterium sp. CAU 1509]